MTVLPVSPNLSVAKAVSKLGNGKTGFWNFKNVRFHLTLLLCLNFLALALMRNGLGIAMVCMVNNTALLEEKINFTHWLNQTSNRTCGALASTDVGYEGEFLWDNAHQGTLFSAIYWGSLTCIVAGWLSDRYSPRHLLQFCVISNVICSFLTPVAAKYGGYIPMVIVRILMGTGQGIQKPAVSAFTARWIPTGERSTVISLYTAGNQLANIIGSPMNAWMCGLKSAFGGWPLIFIVSGTIGCIWCVIWYFYVRNCPDHQRKMNTIEREYIKSNLKTQNLQARKMAAKNVPWKALLFSMPVIACSICSFVNGLYVSLTSAYIPTYFMEVLKLDLNNNGFYGALPYISQWILKFAFAILSDKLIRTRKFRPTTISKVFNSIASFGTGGFILACGFMDCSNAGWAITFLTISMGLFGAFTPGYWTSMVTIAPVYSGTISSLTTTTNQFGSILAPYIVATITRTGSKSEWQFVFLITSSALIATGIFYVFFGSADIQPWAKAPCPEVAPPKLNNITDQVHPWTTTVSIPIPDPSASTPYSINENISDDQLSQSDRDTALIPDSLNNRINIRF